MTTATLLLIFDLLGIFAFAISGNLLAVRLRYDLVASLLLSSLTGLGGGVIRDVILGVPPVAFEQPLYLVIPMVATLFVFVFQGHVARFRRTLLMYDAAGLGLFCVAGTLKSLELGMHPVPAVFLGVTSAAGGGVLRDVVANVTPSALRRDDIYVLPAFAGAALTAVLFSVGLLNAWTVVAAAGLAIALRVLSLIFGWRAPYATLAHHREQADAQE